MVLIIFEPDRKLALFHHLPSVVEISFGNQEPGRYFPPFTMVHYRLCLLKISIIFLLISLILYFTLVAFFLTFQFFNILLAWFETVCRRG